MRDMLMFLVFLQRDVQRAQGEHFLCTSLCSLWHLSAVTVSWYGSVGTVTHFVTFGGGGGALNTPSSFWELEGSLLEPPAEAEAWRQSKVDMSKLQLLCFWCRLKSNVWSESETYGSRLWSREERRKGLFFALQCPVPGVVHRFGGRLKNKQTYKNINIAEAGNRHAVPQMATWGFSVHCAAGAFYSSINEIPDKQRALLCRGMLLSTQICVCLHSTSKRMHLYKSNTVVKVKASKPEPTNQTKLKCEKITLNNSTVTKAKHLKFRRVWWITDRNQDARIQTCSEPKCLMWEPTAEDF